MKTFQEDEGAFVRRNKQLYAIVFYVSVFVSFGICLLAEPVVTLLYGEAYLPAVEPLRFICWYVAFSYLGVARNGWIVCYNCQKYLKWLYASSALMNVVLNVALIPLLGTSGAAIASLATQMATVLLFPAFTKPLRPNAKLMLDAILLKGVLPRR